VLLLLLLAAAAALYSSACCLLLLLLLLYTLRLLLLLRRLLLMSPLSAAIQLLNDLGMIDAHDDLAPNKPGDETTLDIQWITAMGLNATTHAIHGGFFSTQSDYKNIDECDCESRNRTRLCEHFVCILHT
jgi:hypothetical protein